MSSARRRRHTACGVAQRQPVGARFTRLRRLTLAALALPGLLPLAARASDDPALSFDYARYEEGRREVFGYNDSFAPLHADTLRTHGHFVLADAWHASLDFSQDTWAGATPVTSLPLAAMSPLSDAQLLAGASAKPSTGQLAPALVDADMHPYVNGGSPFKPRYVRDARVIDMLTSASPETRKEGHGGLEYEGREVRVKFGGGVSDERDYHARFVDVAGQFDFDHKRSTVGLSFSHSVARSAVTLPSVWLGWVDTRIEEQRAEIQRGELYADGTPRLIIDKARRDSALDVSFTRVADSNTVFNAALGYRRAAGYLDSSYRVMSFLSRDDRVARTALDGSALYGATLYHSYEQRPARRQQFTAGLGMARHIAFSDAALHVDYQYFRDDWSITAHSLALAWHQPLPAGWQVVPRLRYYTQSAARFYQPYVNCGVQAGYDCAVALEHYSSDYRLASFGAWSAGLGINYRVARGVRLELSGEYYAHRGGLGMGSRAAAGFGDFDYLLLNAGLHVEFDGLKDVAVKEGSDRAALTSHHHQHGASMARVPAGVMDAHMLSSRGEWMLGYRYMFASQSGALRHGRHAAADSAVVSGGRCDDGACAVRPRNMAMHMHMLDLMVAPSANWTVMLMPQFVDMNMALSPLAGGAPNPHSSHDGHQSGGVGDLSVVNLLRVAERNNQQLIASLGLSIPVGASDLRLNPVAGHDHDPGTVRQAQFLHYGMQLGSGTYDLGAALVYVGRDVGWSWGARAALTSRLGQRNGAGYALGDKFESSAWIAREVTRVVSVSLRGIASVQGRIKGRFDGYRQRDVQSGEVSLLDNAVSGPMDSPASYGGRYYDIGVGLELALPRAWLGGGPLSIEWLQPVRDVAHGYQLERDGALVVHWSLNF